MLCGAITTWIGIHALFGFFIAGIMVGETKALSEQSREIFSQMVQAILVPLFFASIGLKVDFLARCDLLLVLLILVLTPVDVADAQLRILRDISQTMHAAENRAALLESHSPEEILAGIRSSLEPKRSPAGPP